MKNIFIFPISPTPSAPPPSARDRRLNLNAQTQKEKLQWTEMKCEGDAPKRRSHVAAILFDEENGGEAAKLIVCGGSGYSGFSNSTFELDLKSWTWKELQCEGKEFPAERKGHTGVIVGKKLYIMGGFGAFTANSKTKEDLFVLDLATLHWHQVPKNPCSVQIQLCQNLSSILHDKKIFTFGGSYGGAKCHSICHEYDIERNVWKKVTCFGSIPPPRHCHACVYDEKNGRMLVHGGLTRDGDDDEAHENYTQIFELNLNTYEWKKVRLLPRQIPISLDRHGAVLLANRLVIFGGHTYSRSSPYCGRTYILDFGTPSSYTNDISSLL